MNLIKIWRDIVNYIYLLKQIRKAKKHPNWTRFNLKQGWIGQVWTVINLKKEDMGETIPVQRLYAEERLKPASEFLAGYDLRELLLVDSRKIPGTYGWMFILWPRFYYLTFGLLIKWIIGIIIIWAIFHYTTAGEGVAWLWNMFYDWISVFLKHG